jgi:hypothetical protein
MLSLHTGTLPQSSQFPFLPPRPLLSHLTQHLLQQQVVFFAEMTEF